MRQIIFRFSSHVLCAAVMLAGSGCSALFYEYWNDNSKRLPVVVSPYSGTELHFLGVSSFLIRDGSSSLMIDGYISRPRAALFRPVKPEIDIVESRLAEVGIKLPPACEKTAPAHDTLDATVALHGHFDHALDTPLIAALTGATLIADSAVLQIADRTKSLYPEICPIRKIEKIERTEQPTHFAFGTISLTLVPVQHSSNPASRLLEGAPADPNWSFPTNASNLKIGISLAAHIRTQSGSLLILPTAGRIGVEFADSKLHADTVFLGLGGLGWGSREDAKLYWESTVVTTGAKRVVPIHWDTLSPPLDRAKPAPAIPYYEQLDRALVWMQEFANNDPKIELVSVPVLEPFDPFIAPLIRKNN